MAFTNPSTWVAGDVLTAAQLNEQLRDNMKFFHGPPTVKVRRDTAQSIGSGAWVAVQFTVEDWDSDTIWSSTASNKLFCRTPGKYMATFSSFILGSSAGSRRGVALTKNSTTESNTVDTATIQVDSTAIGDEFSLSVTHMFSLTTSDYITAQMFQDSGSSLNTSTALRFQPKLSMLWVSS